MSRIKSEMQAAARRNQVYHLCLHPHNFGMNRKRNLVFLERVLTFYSELRDRFGMISLNMGEAFEKANNT